MKMINLSAVIGITCIFGVLSFETSSTVQKIGVKVKNSRIELSASLDEADAVANYQINVNNSAWNYFDVSYTGAINSIDDHLRSLKTVGWLEVKSMISLNIAV
jgi:hypothetical protein